MASGRKVSSELGVEGRGGPRLTPGSLHLTTLLPSVLCQGGEVVLTPSSGLLRGIDYMD